MRKHQAFLPVRHQRFKLEKKRKFFQTGQLGLINSFLLVIAFALFWAALLWVFYMAAEPFVRRRRPQLLISWTRLLSGRWRDPIVGRDLLWGAALGFATIVGVFALDLFLPPSFGQPFLVPKADVLELLHRPQLVLGDMVSQVITQAAETLFNLLLILMIRVVVRRLWPAIAITWLLLTLATGPFFGDPLDSFARSLLIFGLYAAVPLFILLRFGLLAATAAAFCTLPKHIPGSADLTAWQAAPMLTSFVVIAALGIFGFYTSLAGRPLFKDSLGAT